MFPRPPVRGARAPRWPLSAVTLSPQPEPRHPGGPASGRAGTLIRPALRAVPPGAPSAEGDPYARWLADFERRQRLREEAVAALAADLASRTPWRVRASGAHGFPAPPFAADPIPHVICERPNGPWLCLEVALPETLVRRETLVRLRRLGPSAGNELWVVLVARACEHPRQIAEGRRLLARAGLAPPFAAIAPDEDALTGATW